MIREFLRVSDCARITQTSQALWRKKILRREIPIVRVGRSVRIAPEDFECYLAVQRREAAK